MFVQRAIAPFILALSVATPSLAQDTIFVPTGNNTEGDDLSIVVGDHGFAISIDGDTVAGNERLSDLVRKKDIALEKANVQVRFDGLETRPSLSLKVLDAPLRPQPGDRVRIASRLNYPSFVERGEIIVYGFDRRLGLTELSRVPVSPNGETVLALPEAERFLVAHRVYDSRGRYDETETISISPDPETDGDHGRADGTPATAELGDMTIRRRIPVHGGTVTVNGTGVRPQATVAVLGETVRADDEGRFVVSRILPPGEVPVRVDVGGGAGPIIERQVTIPRSEWFYVGVVDLTFGRRFEGGVTAAGQPYDRYYSHGRIAGYAKGRTGKGWTITTRFDSGEEELDELFDDRDEQDVAAVLDRLDYSEVGYSEFGDDSTVIDGAPSRGKFFLKAEKNASHVTWGDFKATVAGSRFLRNERTLYGAQGVYRSLQTTDRGEARVYLEAYASQPDRLPQRDVFRGTGGSVYFLSQQDISVGSETVSIEIRDGDTGRVIESRQLVAGQDYDFNGLQGVITLDRPLQSTIPSGLVVTQPGGSTEINLVVQYEYTPTVGQLDGYSYGGRAEVWATDDLRFGVTGLVEKTGSADQKAYGADALYRFGEDSFVALEYAHTDGPGFGYSVSPDGGLVFSTVAPVSGTGSAASADVQLDFADLGLSMPGRFTAYGETRDAGFSTLDYQTASGEDLFGFAFEAEPNERTRVRLFFDGFDDSAGKKVRDAGAEIAYVFTDRIKLEFGVRHERKVTPLGLPTETGRRTDVATRLTFTENEDFAWYVFAQGTADRSGGFEANNRAGVGIDWAFADRWRFEGEISDGNLGVGGEAILSFNDGEGSSAYAGYRLRPGRELDGIALTGRDRGQFVVGGTRQVGDRLDMWAENTYDAFGDHRALTSGYGVDWGATEQLSFSIATEFGRVRDRFTGDVDRKAISLGARWQDGERAEARARVEFRRDEGITNGVNQDQDAVLLTAAGRIKLDEEQRVRLYAEYADIDSATGGLPTGTYAEAGIGYAYRPIFNDRLNVLFQYRFLRDLIGQELNGVAGAGPRQESHIVSVDVEYDLNKQWSVGGKLGGRWSESSPSTGVAFADNDAWLAVVNARYHMTHKWDALVELRHLEAEQGGFGETGVLAAVYRHIGNNAKIGLGYNFGRFSDDLADLTYDDRGIFVNIIAKF